MNDGHIHKHLQLQVFVNVLSFPPTHVIGFGPSYCSLGSASQHGSSSLMFFNKFHDGRAVRFNWIVIWPALGFCWVPTALCTYFRLRMEWASELCLVRLISGASSQKQNRLYWRRLSTNCLTALTKWEEALVFISIYLEMSRFKELF